MADQTHSTEVVLEDKFSGPLGDINKGATALSKTLGTLDSNTGSTVTSFRGAGIEAVKTAKNIDKYGKEVNSTAKKLDDLTKATKSSVPALIAMRQAIKGKLDFLPEGELKATLQRMDQLAAKAIQITTSTQGSKLFQFTEIKKQSEEAVKQASSTAKKIKKIFTDTGIREVTNEYKDATKAIAHYNKQIEDNLKQQGRKGGVKLAAGLGPEIAADTANLKAALLQRDREVKAILAFNAQKVSDNVYETFFKYSDEETKRKAKVLANDLSAELAKITDKAPRQVLADFLSADTEKAAKTRKEYSKVYAIYEKLTKLQEKSRREQKVASVNEKKKTDKVQAKKTALELGIVPDSVTRFDIRTRLTKQARVIAEEFNKISKDTADSFTVLAQKIRQGSKEAIESYTDLADAIRKYDQIIKDAEKNTKGLLISWESFERLVLARIVTQVFYGATQRIFDMTDASLDLSKGIAEIETISQRAGLSTDQWRESVRGLSSEYNFLQEDVVEGAYQAISNQIAAGQEVVDFMATVGPFARATKSDLSSAVELMSSVLNSFQLSVEDTEYAAASMFKTIELGRVRAVEMANTFGRVGVLAQQAGVSLEELNAMTTTLTISGLKFNRASTLIVNVLNKLIKPSDAMQRSIESWGVSSGEAALEVFGLAGVLDRLAQASNYSLGEIAQDVGRIRAVLGFAGLIGDLPRFKRNTEELKNSLADYRKAIELTEKSTGQVLTRQQNKFRNIMLEYNRNILEVARVVNDVFERQGFDLANLTENLVAAIGVPLLTLGSLKFGINALNSMTKGVTSVFDTPALKQFLQDVKELKAQKIEFLGKGEVENAKTISEAIESITGNSGKLQVAWANIITHLPTVVAFFAAVAGVTYVLTQRYNDFSTIILKTNKKVKELTTEFQKQAIITKQMRKDTEDWVQAYKRSEMEKSVLALKKNTTEYVYQLEKVNDELERSKKLQEGIADTILSYLTSLRDYQEDQFTDVEDPREGLRREIQLLVAARDEYYRALGSAPEIADEALQRFTSRADTVRTQYGDYVKDLKKIQQLEIRSQQIPVSNMPEFNLSTEYKAQAKTIEQFYLAQARNQGEWNYVKAAFNEWERIKSEQYKILDKWGFIDPSTGFVIDFHPEMLQRIESERQQFEQYMQASIGQIAGAEGIPLTGRLEQDIATATRARTSLQTINSDILGYVASISKEISESEGFTRQDFEALLGTVPTSLMSGVLAHFSSALVSPLLTKIYDNTAAIEILRSETGSLSKEKPITKPSAEAVFKKTFLSETGSYGKINTIFQQFVQRLDDVNSSLFTRLVIPPLLPSSKFIEQEGAIRAVAEELQKIPEYISQENPLDIQYTTRYITILDQAASVLRELVKDETRPGIKALRKNLEDTEATRIALISVQNEAIAENWKNIGKTQEEYLKDFIIQQDNATVQAQNQGQALVTLTNLLKNPNISLFQGAFFAANPGLREKLFSGELTTQAVDEAFKRNMITNSVIIESKGNIILTGPIAGAYKAYGGAIGGPKGTDTVPAWLTPGEFVVNKQATQQHRPLLENINSGYYAAGGPVLKDGNIDYSNAANWTEKQFLQSQMLSAQLEGKRLQDKSWWADKTFKTAYALDKAGSVADLILMTVGVGQGLRALKMAGKVALPKVAGKVIATKTAKEAAEFAAKHSGHEVAEGSVRAALQVLSHSKDDVIKKAAIEYQRKAARGEFVEVVEAALKISGQKGVTVSKLPTRTTPGSVYRKALTLYKRTAIPERIKGKEEVATLFNDWDQKQKPSDLTNTISGLDSVTAKLTTTAKSNSADIQQYASDMKIRAFKSAAGTKGIPGEQITSANAEEGTGLTRFASLFKDQIDPILTQRREYEQYGIGRNRIENKDVSGELLAKRKRRAQRAQRDKQQAFYSTTWAPALNKQFDQGYVADGINVWDGSQWMPYQAWMEVYDKSFEQLRDLTDINKERQREAKGTIAKADQGISYLDHTYVERLVTGSASDPISYAWIDDKGNRFIFDGTVWHTPENYERMFGSLAVPISNRERWSQYVNENVQKAYSGSQVMYFDGKRWMTKEEFQNWYARDYVTGELPSKEDEADTKKKMASGGWVPGSGNSDSISALLTPGEFVVKASAARQFGSLLQQINGFAGATRPSLNHDRVGYAQGGAVTNTYHNKVDVTLVSSGHGDIDGRRIVNVINREQFKGTARLRGN